MIRLCLWIGVVVLCCGLIRAIFWLTSAPWFGPAMTGPAESIQWAYDNPGFGGLSALLVEDDGSTLTTGSDRGAMFVASLVRDASGQITQIGPVTDRVLVQPNSTPDDYYKLDLEDISRLQDGRLALSFEGYSRIMTATDLERDMVWTHRWNRFESYFGNTAFEALVTLPDGRLMAITEHRGRNGMTRAYVQSGADWTGPFPVPVSPRFRIAGADLGPDGCLYTVERRINLFSGFEYKIMRHWQNGGLWRADADWQSEALYKSAKGHDGNAEGISVWRAGAGLRISLITDDGFLPIPPRTRLTELTLSEGVCR